MALFDKDFDGVPRPQGNAWDIGAYEFGGGAPALPTITLTAPNGGERLKRNHWKSFYWTSTGLLEGAMLKLELSRNDGASYQFLFDTPNSGSANWYVTGPASSLCRIRLSSVEFPAVFGVSFAVFKVI